MIVVDASAVLDLLLNTPDAATLADRLLSGDETLCAPHLLDLEVAQVLRRFAGSGALTARRGSEAIDDLAALPIRRYPHELLLNRIWALRDNATAYDAAYLALAEVLQATVITRDRALAEVPGVTARVEVF